MDIWTSFTIILPYRYLLVSLLPISVQINCQAARGDPTCRLLTESRMKSKNPRPDRQISNRRNLQIAAFTIFIYYNILSATILKVVSPFMVGRARFSVSLFPTLGVNGHVIALNDDYHYYYYYCHLPVGGSHNSQIILSSPSRVLVYSQHVRPVVPRRISSIVLCVSSVRDATTSVVFPSFRYFALARRVTVSTISPFQMRLVTTKYDY